MLPLSSNVNIEYGDFSQLSLNVLTLKSVYLCDAPAGFGDDHFGSYLVEALP